MGMHFIISCCQCQVIIVTIIIIIAAVVVFLICVLVLSNRLIANYITLAVGEVLLLILTFCSLAAIFPRVSYHTLFEYFHLKMCTLYSIICFTTIYDLN